MKPASHIPVLLSQTLEAFSPCRLKVYVDATVGLAGHFTHLMQEHKEIEKAIAIDQDAQALAIAKENTKKWEGKITFIHDNFSSALASLEELYAGQVDGILLDIGVSSMQLDTAERGFSFLRDGPLDMRMNSQQGLSAEEFVNDYPLEKLMEVIRRYGEEKHWRKISFAIDKARRVKRITSTRELACLIEQLPFPKQKVHPATKTFQAIRIFVNNELEVLKCALAHAIKLLKPKGRLAVITFHSLEDRIVKKFFAYEAQDKVSTSGIGGIFLDKEPSIVLPYRKPFLPSNEETLHNPRARSAKLRVCEKR